MQVGVVCQNRLVADTNPRLADPTDAADGKVEEGIDMKRLVHLSHTGAELQNEWSIVRIDRRRDSVMQ
jgi:hypothetical protein